MMMWVGNAANFVTGSMACSICVYLHIGTFDLTPPVIVVPVAQLEIG
jgi:hypothetical protein